MTSAAVLISPVVESIHRSFSDICVPDEQYSWENPRRFSAYAKRLQLLLNQLLRTTSEEFSPSVQTALRGIAGDLTASCQTTSVYRSKGKIFVLIHCQSLCKSLQERTRAIGGWLSLLDSVLEDHPDLRKKIADHSREMKQAQFRVTENEERVHCTLQKEGQGRQTTKAVQSAIIMDLARALGIDSSNQAELSGQVMLLKNDLASSNSLEERRILISLERIMDNWSTEPDPSTRNLDLDFEDDANIAPFKNFLCPLTKEAMKDPVVLESSQNYEREAIQYWFERCIEDGRDPTCPVTGQVLKSLDLKPNIGLAGAIEEWVSRIIDMQIKLAMQYLSEDPLPEVDCIERMLDNIYKISEEHPSSRYKVRNAGIVDLVVKLLKNRPKSFGSHLRSKALAFLLSMTKDEESKKIMVEEGITRLGIHSLVGSSEKEREYAVKLLLDFTSDEAYCVKIASEKGALVFLSNMAANLEHPALSNLAEEVLKQIEAVEDNIQILAVAGRFEPLLSRLREGPEVVKIKMASMVGRMTLSNSSKEQIARQSAEILVQLLCKAEGIEPSLRALYILSTLDDNATILVDSSILPALADILFKNNNASEEMKALAASTIANIVSNPGYWELAPVDKRGHTMQSESTVSSLLGLLSISSSQCQVYVLRILYGIASSPQASEQVAKHIKAGDGIKIIIPFLEHQEVEHKICAFRLIRVLSLRLGQDLVGELYRSDKLPLLKEKLLDHQSAESEKCDAACILANLPFSEDQVKIFLGPSFLKWTVTYLKSEARPTSSIVVGLVGILLHFARRPDLQWLTLIKEHRLMTLFRDQMSLSSKPKVKKLSALGLKYLSESGRTLGAFADADPQPPRGFCFVLVLMCGKNSPKPSTCPIHNAFCEEDSQFCLLKSDCIKPLTDLLSYKDTSIQIAAVEALSTLLLDTSCSNLKRAVDVLENYGVVDSVINLFIDVRPGELQERVIFVVDRILRVESQNQRYSLSQPLVRALVEAYRHGSTNTRMYAQDALANLKQISGVSGRNSSQPLGRR